MSRGWMGSDLFKADNIHVLGRFYQAVLVVVRHSGTYTFLIVMVLYIREVVRYTELWFQITKYDFFVATACGAEK